MPDTVNAQVTDAYTQSNVMSVAIAPGMAMGYLYQGVAQSLVLSSGNMSAAQHNANIILEATTATATAIIYSQKPKT